jgi:hypothetical protein
MRSWEKVPNDEEEDRLGDKKQIEKDGIKVSTASVFHRRFFSTSVISL